MKKNGLSIVLAMLFTASGLVGMQADSTPQQQLIQYVKDNNTPAVQQLLSKVIITDLDQILEHGNTIMHIAAQEATAEMCHFLIQKGFRADRANDELITPLFIAVEKADKGKVEAFVERGKANIRAEKKDKYSVLQHAVSVAPKEIGTQITIVQYLVEKVRSGAGLFKKKQAVRDFINDKASCGFTPLYIAADKDKPYIADYLVEQGADINAADQKTNATPLDIAEIRKREGKDSGIAAMLMLKGGKRVTTANL